MRQQDLKLGKASGFSLVELMVVLTIVAIMMRFGLASYASVTTKDRLAAEVNEFVLAVQYARAEAIREGTNVTICASSTGNTCSTATTTWNQGWIVFSDVNGSGTVDANDLIYRVQAGLTNTDTIVIKNNTKTTPFTFNRLGLMTTATSSTTISTSSVELLASNTSADASVYQCAIITSLGSVTTASGASC